VKAKLVRLKSRAGSFEVLEFGTGLGMGSAYGGIWWDNPGFVGHLSGVRKSEGGLTGLYGLYLEKTAGTRGVVGIPLYGRG
jgi:hypothetical protein